MTNKRIFIFFILLVCFTAPAAARGGRGSSVIIQREKSPIPHLEKRGKTIQLIVDGKPYLIVGGELHNSSSSSLEYMKQTWSRLAQAHLNTVLAAVSWELIEPQEGKFDFHLVDGMIQQARKNNLHLVFLWFGSWKNSTSTYAPGWVKGNEQRFPLVQNEYGKSLDILTPLSQETMKADANAFAHLMRHIKQIDGNRHTVIMMQVENEVGVLGDSRDRSGLANEAFAQPVPDQLIRYLQSHKGSLRPHIYNLWENNGFKTSGNWTDVFGSGTATDELFMAWQYAHFINQVAKAGKAEYPLPMYVNAWIVQPQDRNPGDYPSGGPQTHVHDIWKAAAPEIDMLVPDIYLPHFVSISQDYREPDKGFFIPESRAGAKGAANAFYAIGACNAIGYSPFGVDGIKDLQANQITKAYGVLSQLAPLILKAQEKGNITSVVLDKNHRKQDFHLGDYILHVRRLRGWDTTQVADKGYALIITTAPDEYIVAGNDFQIHFSPASGTGTAGFDYVEEGTFRQGQWHPGRRLNGDEISGRTGNRVRIANGPEIRKVKVYSYK